MKEWEQPEVLNTDKAPAYAAAIAELKAEGKCPKDTRHRQVKYLNNVIEADHGKLKLLIRPVRGFKGQDPTSPAVARQSPSIKTSAAHAPSPHFSPGPATLAAPRPGYRRWTRRVGRPSPGALSEAGRVQGATPSG